MGCSCPAPAQGWPSFLGVLVNPSESKGYREGRKNDPDGQRGAVVVGQAGPRVSVPVFQAFSLALEKLDGRAGSPQGITTTSLFITYFFSIYYP